MGKLLVISLVMAMVGYFGYWAMYKAQPTNLEDKIAHAPKRQLDNVREAAKNFEAKDQRNMDAIDRKTTGE